MLALSPANCPPPVLRTPAICGWQIGPDPIEGMAADGGANSFYKRPVCSGESDRWRVARFLFLAGFPESGGEYANHDKMSGEGRQGMVLPTLWRWKWQSVRREIHGDPSAAKFMATPFMQ